MVADGIEEELRHVACRRASHNVGLPGAEAIVFSQFVAKTVTAWEHRQGTANMGADHLKLRKFFKTAGEDEACQRQCRVERSTEHLWQTKDLHLLIADGELGRMDEDRHVEIADQFKKWRRPRRVEILAASARVNHDALEFVVADRFLGFFENLTAIERHRASETKQPFGVLGG